MKVLSFDIGIKNLAYCIVDMNKNIQKWNIINISCDEVCNHVSSNGTHCDKSSTYIINDKNLCTSHSKLKKYNGFKKKKVKKNNNLFDIGNKLIKAFNNLFINEEYNYVIIENQPALKNPTMKSIQMIVYTYFLINGNGCNVEMINARNKLKVYNGPNIKQPYIDNKANKYKINKFLAIKYCEYMIQNESTQFIDLFNNSKKKDDLSDCYLQAIYWINKYIL